jgi:hypothetical protein
VLPLQIVLGTWQCGVPSLQRSVDKLVGTWAGVFPQPLLDSIAAQLVVLRAQQQAQQPYLAAAPSYATYAAPAPALAQPPMYADTRLQSYPGAPQPQQQYPLPQQPGYYGQPPPQQPAPIYAPPAPSYAQPAPIYAPPAPAYAQPAPMDGGVPPYGFAPAAYPPAALPPLGAAQPGAVVAPAVAAPRQQQQPAVNLPDL